MAKLEDFSVKNGEQVIIEGDVTFSEVANKVEGERLEAKIKRERERGSKFPTTTPHYSISLENIKLDDKYIGTPLAKFIGDKSYTNKDGNLAISLISKSKFPIELYHEQANGTVVKLDKLPAEIATGQKVKVLVRAYDTDYANMGHGFNSILFPEGEINYYSKGAGSSIEAYGYKPEDVVDENGNKGQKQEATASSEDVADNPFGGETAEQKEQPKDSVPEDAKPDAPSGGVVDNPFA